MFALSSIPISAIMEMEFYEVTGAVDYSEFYKHE